MFEWVLFTSVVTGPKYYWLSSDVASTIEQNYANSGMEQSAIDALFQRGVTPPPEAVTAEINRQQSRSTNMQQSVDSLLQWSPP